MLVYNLFVLIIEVYWFFVDVLVDLINIFIGRSGCMFYGEMFKVQIVIQLVSQEFVYLGFFIWMVYKLVGVVIDWCDLVVVIIVDYFGYGCIVIDMNGYLWVIQLVIGVVNLFQQQGFGVFCGLQEFDLYLVQIEIFLM